MSARIIGREFGKSAAEMNKMLAQYGYLEGAPGLWRFTSKGEEYAHERHEHRGTGGYAHYNRDWTVTTYDDSIIDALKADIAANPNPPEIDYSAPAVDSSPDEQPRPAGQVVAEQRGGLTDLQKLLLLAGGLAAAAYGVKKALPRAKRVWQERKDRKAAQDLPVDSPPADDLGAATDTDPTPPRD